MILSKITKLKQALLETCNRGIYPNARMFITQTHEGVPDYESAYLAQRLRTGKRLLKELHAGRGGKLGFEGIWQQRPTFPIAACFNVHTVCNEACRMCPYPNEWGHGNHIVMPFHEYKRILDQFESSGGRIVTFNNFSDIFAHKAGMAYLTEAITRHPRIQTYIVTNGMSMKEIYIDELLSLGFEGIVYVSCHGFSHDTFKAVTGRRGFDQVLKHATYLIQQHPYPERVVIQYATDYSTKEEIDAARTYWSNLGAHVNFFATHTFAGNSSHKEPFVHIGRLAGCKGWGKDAGQPFYQVVVQPNGDVSLCCHDLRAECVMGNVFEDDLKTVWNSPAFMQLVRDLYLGESSDPSFICRNCGLAQLVSANE